MVADRVIGRALQHIDTIEFVRRHRNLWVVRADPPLAGKKAGHPLPFGNVFEIVPVVELVLGEPAEIDYRNQNAVCHQSLTWVLHHYRYTMCPLPVALLTNLHRGPTLDQGIP